MDRTGCQAAERQTEESPGLTTVSAGTSLRKQAEVRGPQVAQKSRSPDVLAARTAYRHW